MNTLGLVLHNDVWMQQSEALSAEFSERFEAVDFRDADAFYQLALWADQYGDILPQAAELRHQALQAGHKADPQHNGIRKALDLPAVSTAGGVLANIFTDESIGLAVTPLNIGDELQTPLVAPLPGFQLRMKRLTLPSTFFGLMAAL